MSPIPGYETRELCLAQIGALERELRGHVRDARHRAQIAESLKTFRKALKEIEAEGDPVDKGRRTGQSTLVKNASTGLTYQQWIN
jgi:hypothetical protein